MTLIALIRHAATDWNEGGRVQSTTDVPLSEGGRSAVRSGVYQSTLMDSIGYRARFPAPLKPPRILSGRAPSRLDDRLVEMDWAAWEGMTIDELRAEIGNPGEAWRAGGLDFKAPGGERSARCSNAAAFVFRGSGRCQSAKS